MKPRSGVATAPAKKQIRAAVYCRKSTEHGLGQEYNSLDAQRDACTAYIATMKHAGWVCVADDYSDGGWSGGNTERPALQRLLADIEAGKIDAVVVHRVDRLSRSLLDFTQMLTLFERHGVSFASVTQSFDTASSMGRLTMHILLSFAEFERSMIGERIRDKIGAQRRRGMWAGGKPVLGYDIDRSAASPRLVVNAAEAERVRAIFTLYLELGSLMPVVEELRRRGWTAKAWTTKAGRSLGGQPFDKPTVHALLTNPIVTGKIVHKGAVHDGQHEAIVPRKVFDRVQERLKANARSRCMVRADLPRAAARPSVLHLGRVCEPSQLPARIEETRLVFQPINRVGQDASGVDAKGLHGRVRAGLLWMEGGRSPQVVWAEQRKRLVACEEDPAAADAALNSEERRARRARDRAFVAAG